MEIYSKKDGVNHLKEYGLIYGGLAILILLTSRFLPISYIPLFCPFKTITGIPCPTCGGSRSLIHFVHLNLVGSFSMNPLISVSIILAIIFFLYSIAAFFLKPLRLEVKFNQKEKTTLRFATIAVITMNWFYLIIAGI